MRWPQLMLHSLRRWLKPECISALAHRAQALAARSRARPAGASRPGIRRWPGVPHGLCRVDQAGNPGSGAELAECLPVARVGKGCITSSKGYPARALIPRGAVTRTSSFVGDVKAVHGWLLFRCRCTDGISGQCAECPRSWCPPRKHRRSMAGTGWLNPDRQPAAAAPRAALHVRGWCLPRRWTPALPSGRPVQWAT